MARGLCYKPRAVHRHAIPTAPMQPGEKYRLNAETNSDEPTYDEAYLAKVDYDLWLGPGPQAALQPQPLPLQLALALGLRQRRHRQPGPAPVRHRALGPGQAASTRSRSRPRAASSATAETSQETPNVHTALFTYADGKVLEFATRGTFTNDEGTQKIGNLFYGTKGWLWIDGDGRTWQSYLGRKNEKGPGRGASGRPRAATPTCSPASSTRTTRTSSTPSARATEQAQLRHRRGPPVLGPAPPRQHRLPGGPAAHVRRQEREVRGRRRGRRAADAHVSRAVRGPGQGVAALP